MAQLGKALFGDTVSWHADKRVLDDLRGAQTAMVSVCAFSLSLVYWRPRGDRSSCRCQYRVPLGPKLSSLFKTDCLVIDCFWRFD